MKPDALATAPDHTVVMTGASRGLGRVAAVEMLRRDPGLHLAVLVRSGGERVAGEIASESGTPHITTYEADLSSIASIRRAIAAITADLDGDHLPPLTGLVGNAGLQLLSTTGATEDGIETTFAVNVVANHALIAGLADRLVAPARIVLTASDTHFGDFAHNLGMVPAPVWRSPSLLATPGVGPKADAAGAGRTAYATSKLAVIYLVHALARRLPPGVEIVSFNPGLVPGTGLARDGGPLTRFAFRTILPALTLTPWARRQSVSGGDLASLALGKTASQNGDYVNGKRAEPSSGESYDEGREEELIAELERLASTSRATNIPNLGVDFKRT